MKKCNQQTTTGILTGGLETFKENYIKVNRILDILFLLLLFVVYNY